MAPQEDKGDIVVVRDIPLLPLLERSRVMVTIFSTTALEAMMLDVPVITVNTRNRPDLMPYAGSGAALGVRDLGDLEDAIRRAATDEKTREGLAAGRKRFLSSHLYKMDSRSSERVLLLLSELVRSRKRPSEGAQEGDAGEGEKT
jgi:glycosyltransferase involved in cell wall biosynthesis